MLKVKATIAAVAMAVTGGAQAANINSGDMIVNIAKDNGAGESMLINTGLNAANLTTTSWNSDPALTTAISDFIAGASGVVFWATGWYEAAPSIFDATLHTITTKELTNRAGLDNFKTNWEGFKDTANNDAAFAAAADNWLAGIDPSSPIHYTSTSFGGLFAPISLGVTGTAVDSNKGIGLNTAPLASASVGFWDLEANGSLNYSPVPVPAAVWLFGSGLIGLVGIARRRKSA